MSDRHVLTPEEAERILCAVPVGADNAKGWRWVWEILDEGSPITIRNKLAILVGQERVKRREIQTNSGTMYVYWRDMPNAERAA